MTKIRRVAAKGLAALGVAGLAVAGAAGAAFADPGGEATSPEIGNINPDAKGSLTINKYAGLPTENPLEENLLDGVEFAVQRVGVWTGDDALACVPIDLLTNAGWDAAAPALGHNNVGEPAPVAADATDPAPAAGDFCVDDTWSDSGVTQDGQVKFEDLDLGMYYVTETDPGENHIVKTTSPFYVTIPTAVTGEAAPYWNYDVVADPKNQVGEAPSKTVDTEGLVVGSDVDWTITGVVPTLEEDAEFTEGSIWDVLDPRLTYVGSVLTVGDVQVYPAPDGADVRVTFDNDDGDLTWTFVDPAGLEFLDANPGADIELVITTTVNEAFDTGVIPNDDYGFSWNDTEIPGTPTPYTYVGGLKVLKTDDSDRPLQGAQFQVFERGVDGEGAYVACPEKAPTTGIVSTGTSGADGKVMWTPPTPASEVLGLWIADSDEPLENPSKDYCLYETVVPSGYTGMQGAKTVTITPGTTWVPDQNSFEIVNTQTQGPPLPPTGANGTTLMVIGGVALVALAGGLYMVNRRKTTQA